MILTGENHFLWLPGYLFLHILPYTRSFSRMYVSQWSRIDTTSGNVSGRTYVVAYNWDWFWDYVVALFNCSPCIRLMSAGDYSNILIVGPALWLVTPLYLPAYVAKNYSILWTTLLTSFSTLFSMHLVEALFYGH